MNIPLYCLSHRDEAGQSLAVVAPGWGANIVAFSFQARDWAWPIPVLEQADMAATAMKPTSYGIPILAPTPGRVGVNQNGLFTYHGRTYRITPSRHGFLRNIPWTVANQRDSEITCTVDVKPAGAEPKADSFPFDFHAESRVEVIARTLRCCLRIENTGAITQPLNVGWHPYLHRSAPCLVRIPADSRWELNRETEPTPTGRLLKVAGRDDFRSGRLLECNEHWDDVFTDLSDEGGLVSCWTEEGTTIFSNDNRRLAYSVRRGVTVCPTAGSGGAYGIRNIQLFTPLGRNAISVEPLSAPPDAINLLAQGHQRADVCEVPPGGEVAFELAVWVDATLQ